MSDSTPLSERVAAFGLTEGDAVLVAQLAGRAVDIESFVYIPGKEAAESVAASLNGDGYVARSEGTPEYQLWCVVATRTLLVTPLAIVALRRQMEAVAREAGGRFDGWGAGLSDAVPPGLEAETQAFARERILRYPGLPLAWPHDRAERLARGILSRTSGTLIEASVERADHWRPNKAWNFRAALEDAGQEIEAVAYLQYLRVPASGPALERTSVHYWLREAEFLSNTVAPKFPMPAGLRTPRYVWLMVLRDKQQQEVGRYCAWERRDVPDATDWGIDRFALAAHALGRWQAAPVADASAFEEPSLLQDPLAMIGYESAEHPSKDAPKRREALKQRLSALPMTVCHQQLSCLNLYEDAEDSGVTLVRDWNAVGRAPVGSDLAGLVFQGSQSNGVGIRSLEAMETKIFDAYIDGLRASGWSGDPLAVRLAYAATASLEFSDAKAESTPELEALNAYARRLGDEALAH